MRVIWQQRWRCLDCKKVLTDFDERVVPRFLYARSVIVSRLRRWLACETGERVAAIAERGVQGLAQMLGRKASVNKQVHPHLFRHWLATNLLRKQVNPVQIPDILGHPSLAMIDRVYSHLVASDAIEARWRRSEPVSFAAISNGHRGRPRSSPRYRRPSTCCMVERFRRLHSRGQAWRTARALLAFGRPFLEY